MGGRLCSNATEYHEGLVPIQGGSHKCVNRVVGLRAIQGWPKVSNNNDCYGLMARDPVSHADVIADFGALGGAAAFVPNTSAPLRAIQLRLSNI